MFKARILNIIKASRISLITAYGVNIYYLYLYHTKFIFNIFPMSNRSYYMSISLLLFLIVYFMDNIRNYSFFYQIFNLRPFKPSRRNQSASSSKIDYRHSASTVAVHFICKYCCHTQGTHALSSKSFKTNYLAKFQFSS